MDMTKGRSGIDGTQKTLIQEDITLVFDNSPALEESKNNDTRSPHRMALDEQQREWDGIKPIFKHINDNQLQNLNI